ncbi:MAG: hypothetical protein HZA08_08475 [Nitrospirae bacterium]|nr:hypothetical protein [Nitrospirota bacterium]
MISSYKCGRYPINHINLTGNLSGRLQTCENTTFMVFITISVSRQLTVIGHIIILAVKGLRI